MKKLINVMKGLTIGEVFTDSELEILEVYHNSNYDTLLEILEVARVDDEYLSSDTRAPKIKVKEYILDELGIDEIPVWVVRSNPLNFLFEKSISLWEIQNFTIEINKVII